MTSPERTAKKEEKFTGAISSIHDGAAYDADSIIVVGGKKVIFRAGWRTGPWGRLKGINLGNDIDCDRYNGRKAEVYARKITKGYPKGGYTLEGDTKYHVSLLKT